MKMKFSRRRKRGGFIGKWMTRKWSQFQNYAKTKAKKVSDWLIKPANLDDNEVIFDECNADVIEEGLTKYKFQIGTRIDDDTFKELIEKYEIEKIKIAEEENIDAAKKYNQMLINDLLFKCVYSFFLKIYPQQHKLEIKPHDNKPQLLNANECSTDHLVEAIKKYVGRDINATITNSAFAHSRQKYLKEEKINKLTGVDNTRNANLFRCLEAHFKNRSSFT